VSEPHGGLVVTYHAIEEGDSPLCIEPALFEEHVEALAAATAAVLTVSELARGARDGTLPEGAVAITFDDAFASVSRAAAPILDRHGYPATVFAVVDHLGGANDWSTQPAHAPRRPLLGVEELRSLAAGGWEVGSHGLSHTPLGKADAVAVGSELGDSRARLAELTGGTVTSFAFPYGSVPVHAGRHLADAGYETGLGARLGRVDGRSDPYLLPRVDAHYLRRTPRLLDALEGRIAYLRLRGVAARVRRMVRADYR
jgi:peptidoglycan/xylan/chitin deacetylase (PgdA/CDA1 family)